MSKGPPMPNLPRVLLRAPLRVMAWTLLLLVGLATPLKRGISFTSPRQAHAKGYLHWIR